MARSFVNSPLKCLCLEVAQVLEINPCKVFFSWGGWVDRWEQGMISLEYSDKAGS